MKALVTAIALLVSFGARSATVDCNNVAEFAEVIMEARQVGVSMPKAIELANGSKLLEKIIVDAYEVPHYSTQEYRSRKISDFRDSWYLACFKAMSE